MPGAVVPQKSTALSLPARVQQQLFVGVSPAPSQLEPRWNLIRIEQVLSPRFVSPEFWITTLGNTWRTELALWLRDEVVQTIVGT